MSRRPAEAAGVRDGWILSPRGDAAIFAGPLLLSGLVILWASRAGRLHDPLPPWLFALLVVGCDVAHVWSTLFRTYLDPEERRRRGGLLAGVPLGCLVAGVALYSLDPSGDLFWRVLAYLAAFHFVRQQYGWVAWSARKAGETDPWDRRLDGWMIYGATLFPLLWWHAHLPRSFDWFRQGDFAAGLPPAVATAGHVAHGAIAAAWIGRQAWRGFTGRGINPAKWLIVGSTWVTWYGGIVLLDSDIAFTATNCLAHGIPYLAVVHRWGTSRWRGEGGVVAALFRPAGFVAFYGLLFALAFVEEGFWDRLVWHESAHGALFPVPSLRLGSAALAVLVPLLAVPQAAHYVLDAFLWRSGPGNPGLAEHLGLVSKQPRRTECERGGPGQGAKSAVAPEGHKR